ncbi:uncharacterized protein TrAtP1_004255 [Trichoderma atroviride]|uniref:uncharacterized protein n=1 Tax=Hypocrea atroviridis TaxID=63577 RepID=UPI00332FFBD7|nr:hypothetical protein TrAtP1_004255 [Trichoderma atroviride]
MPASFEATRRGRLQETGRLASSEPASSTDQSAEEPEPSQRERQKQDKSKNRRRGQGTGTRTGAEEGRCSNRRVADHEGSKESTTQAAVNGES